VTLPNDRACGAYRDDDDIAVIKSLREELTAARAALRDYQAAINYDNVYLALLEVEKKHFEVIMAAMKERQG